jgi:murein DD-endopeptidase MepM/ murein hydrolase activator NlpD
VKARLTRLKPGWYVLLALALYALVVTVLLARASGAEGPAAPASEPVAESAPLASAALAPEGLWFPVPGARLPASDDNLPGAPRAYRHGVSQGFDLFPEDAGVPIVYGTPVVAAADGQIVRADVGFTEMDPRAWEVLMADVEEAGADASQLDQLRGRQVWLRTADGTVLRYGHLSAVRTGVRTGTNVYRGQVLGFVGNSGTDRAVAGSQEGARLRFEIWLTEDEFFGAGMEATEVRLAAATLFVGP